MGTRERRQARLARLERLSPARPAPAPLPSEAIPAATELAFLAAHGDQADAARASLLALRLHALLPLPGRPDHPTAALLEHLERREARKTVEQP